VHQIWRLHGLPKRIVSDRDMLFMSWFWQEVMRLLEVALDKSSPYHPQTDGQTEQVNQVLEHYLRTYYTWDQDNWVELRPFAGFCYNNTIHSATKLIPFFAAYQQHLQNNFKHAEEADPESNNPEAVKTVETLKGIRRTMRENIEAAQCRMVKYFNLKVAEKEPTFKAGDWVIVNAKNIKTRHLTRKLDYKLCGKFRIKRLIGTNAYELELPSSTSKIHLVFHISLFQSYHLNNIPGRHSPTPPPVDVEETEYHVEKIRTSELRKGRVWYLVPWKVYGPDDDTWEPYENLRDGTAATVLKFHQDNPRKLRDPAVFI